MDEEISRTYKNVGEPGSLSSPQTLAKVTGHTRKQAGEYLKGEPSYTLHRNRRIKGSQYRKTFAYGPLDIAQADLLVLDKLHVKHNKPFRYILLVVSIFSRYAIGLPLKSKTGSEVAKALDTILSNEPYKKLQTDRGTEFINPKVRSVLNKHGTLLYHSHSHLKAAIVERFIRTLRLLISRYCTLNNTATFIGNFQKIIKIYNEKEHSSLLNKSPIEAHKDNSINFFVDQYAKVNRKKKPAKFKVGDVVRINRNKVNFEKGNYSWSTELFKISEILDTTPITYRLRDFKDELILGGFYDYELQEVKDTGRYLIEKVIKSKFVNGIKQYLVRWQGYNSKFDSWVSSEHLNNVQQ